MAQPEKIGTYQVLRELGRGAMGVVYLCLHPGLGRQVAVKVLSAQVAGEADFLERFRREGEMSARLRHPNIVQVYDFSNDGDTYFIVMEYLGSQTLKSGAARPLPEALRLLDQLLAALEHAHECGVIHRDLKPSNILLTDKGEVALTDFGIAYSALNQKLTRTGTAMGTPEYMAPEQFDGKSDARSDLYSVGIIFYEMLTGFTPFHAETLTEVMKNQVLKTQASLSEVDFTIPAAISTLVDQVLSKDPKDRFQSSRELREALHLAQMAPPPIQVQIPSPAGQASTRVDSQPSRRSVAPLKILGLAMLLLAGLVLWGRHRPGQVPPVASEVKASSPALLKDSPTPVNTPALVPVAVETQSPTPELQLTETPELATETASETATPAAGQLPEEGMIRPGVGVADINLGDSTDQVEQLWGAPSSSFEEEGKLHWYFASPGEQDHRFGLAFEQGKLIEIDVYAPKFSVIDHPDLAMGVKVEKVREELANPSNDQDVSLDYNELGIYFYFNHRGSSTLPRFGENGCEDIRIYSPGMTRVR